MSLDDGEGRSSDPEADTRDSLLAEGMAPAGSPVVEDNPNRILLRGTAMNPEAGCNQRHRRNRRDQTWRIDWAICLEVMRFQGR